MMQIEMKDLSFSLEGIFTGARHRMVGVEV